MRLIDPETGTLTRAFSPAPIGGGAPSVAATAALSRPKSEEPVESETLPEGSMLISTVKPLQLEWDAIPIAVVGDARLPTMRTDVYLESHERRIIIDTKYYAEALQERHGTTSFRSDNLLSNELRHQYVDALAPEGEPYDVLLDDFEPETKTEDVTRIFAELRDELIPLIAELRERDVDDSFLKGDFPVDRQIPLLVDVIDTFGHRPDSWRIDPTEHPFASSAGRDDIRITTHYYPDNLDSLFSTMHEYGHGLYQHQLPEAAEGQPVGGPASLGIHESQSRLWENLVGRSLAFWRFYYPRVQERFPQLRGVDVERWYVPVNTTCGRSGLRASSTRASGRWSRLWPISSRNTKSSRRPNWLG